MTISPWLETRSLNRSSPTLTSPQPSPGTVTSVSHTDACFRLNVQPQQRVCPALRLPTLDRGPTLQRPILRLQSTQELIRPLLLGRIPPPQQVQTVLAVHFDNEILHDDLLFAFFAEILCTVSWQAVQVKDTSPGQPPIMPTAHILQATAQSSSPPELPQSVAPPLRNLLLGVQPRSGALAPSPFVLLWSRSKSQQYQTPQVHSTGAETQRC